MALPSPTTWQTSRTLGLPPRVQRDAGARAAGSDAAQVHRTDSVRGGRVPARVSPRK